jgi:predicted Zn finger-like uncharacterized protein
MALATRCPHCGTRFRVASEQLRLRNGIVRCGDCLEVFNAADRLDYVDAMQATSLHLQDLVAPSTEHPSPFVDEAAIMPGNTLASGDNSPRMADALTPVGEAAHASAPVAPPPLPEAGANTTSATDTVPGQIQDLLPTRTPASSPSFARTPTPARQALMIVVNLVLVVTLLGQILWCLHPALITAFPDLRSGLDSWCRPLGCHPRLPQESDRLAVIASDLRSIPGTSALQLDLTIRNRANHIVALPFIELALTDTQEHLSGRRVFPPSDYRHGAGSGALANEGIPAGADLDVHLLLTAPSGGAAGFVAYPFYP